MSFLHGFHGQKMRNNNVLAYRVKIFSSQNILMMLRQGFLPQDIFFIIKVPIGDFFRLIIVSYHGFRD